MQRLALHLLTALALTGSAGAVAPDGWVIDSQEQWTQATQASKGLAIEDGFATPSDKTATFASKVRRFDQKCKATTITFDQSPIWQNWQPIKNLGPVNMQDAPVFLSLGPDNYWVFYLFTQQKTDYVSDGPWVERVEARLGVDTDNDGNLDQWTDWQQVQEAYDDIQGFSKQVSKTPAKLDVSNLPAGFGFSFEVKLTDTTENKATPVLDRVILAFQ